MRLIELSILALFVLTGCTNSSGEQVADTAEETAVVVSSTQTNSTTTTTQSQVVTTTTKHSAVIDTPLADTTGPKLITLAPPSSGVFLATQTLDFTATFDEVVTVTGSPDLSLDIGGTTVSAVYGSGSGSTTLIFSYTVTGTNDFDGIGLNATVFGASEITDAAGNAATLDFTVPSLTGVSVSTPWITQLGATTGSGSKAGADICYAVSTDTSGNVFCAGITTGALGETNGGGAQDAFIMKLNSSGVFQWVTQLGDTTGSGSSSGDDQCLGVSTDSSGNVYCTGYTRGIRTSYRR